MSAEHRDKCLTKIFYMASSVLQIFFIDIQTCLEMLGIVVYSIIICMKKKPKERLE